MAENNLSGAAEQIIAKLKELVETETIIGKPINVKENTVIIPISKVSFGFGLGGDDTDKQNKHFHLGSGAGGSVTPIGFLIVDEHGASVIEIGNTTQMEGLLNSLPELYERFSAIFKKDKKNKKESTQEQELTQEC